MTPPILPSSQDAVAAVNADQKVSYNIERLDGVSNYMSWKFSMKMALILENLWECVTSNVTTDAGRDRRALARICLAIKPTCFQYVREAETARAAWQKLSEVFEDKGLYRRVGLLRQLHRTEYSNYGSMSEYINGTMTIVQQLADIGRSTEDAEVAELLLSGLPQEFDTLVSSLETAAVTSQLSSELVRTRLLQEEFRRSSTEDTNANAAFDTDAKKLQAKSCSYCSRPGHVKARCFKLKRDKKRQQGKDTSLIASTAFLAQDEWIVDSGCSAHMCNNKEALQNFKATKDRRANFRRRTKATAPPDGTEPTAPLTATETLQDATTPPTRYTYTRRGNSKFNKQTQAGRKELKKDTKEAEKDAKNGAKVEIRTRPSLNASPKQTERPTRTFVRRRLGGASNGTTSSTSSPKPPSTTAVPSASPSSRRPFRVTSRRRLPASTSPNTSPSIPSASPSTSTRLTTPVTTTHEATETRAAATETVTGVQTTTAEATKRFSEESLQEIEDADSIEDPALRPRIAQTPKKTVKIQRRPLTSLRTNKDIDQNPEATNEEKKSKDLSKEDDRKRQSKKYSASFKQNQLDEVIRLKTKSQEEFDATTAGGTTDDYSAETAVAIAAHQLLSAPLPSLQDFEDQAKTNTKKSNTYRTTQEYQYTSPAFTADTDDFNDGQDNPRPESLKLPVFSSTPRPTFSSTPIYRTTYPGVPNQGFSRTSIPLSGYSKTSGYSSTPGYSSTSFTGSTPQRHSEYATGGFLGGGYSVSPLGPSTARYLGSSSKYVAVATDDYGYTGGLSQEPSYFTREYLLESPVTKTYDDEYQYLSPTTPRTTTRKVPKKTVFRRISTTIRPTSPPALVSTTAKPRRVPQKKPFEKIAKPEPGRTYRPIENYDYYDDSQEKLVQKYADGTKVIVHGKDTIECLDVGNFPHPSSCSKFISCSPRSGGLLGWEYVCPRGLSFDPVGGMCNWSAGLGCDEN